MQKDGRPYRPESNSEYSEETILNSSERYRTVCVGLPTTEKFCSNKVITAHYSLWTWIPKSLIEQFARMNNFYFLILCILSLFPFSPKNPWAIIGTLGAVLIFTMIKEGIEDIGRSRQDKEVNQKKIQRFSQETLGFELVQCQHVSVGDLVKIEENQSFPADLVLILSSNSKGLVYVDTINLDGENALKEKMTAHCTGFLSGQSELNRFKAEFYVDKPNPSLVKWNCNINIRNSTEPMTTKQLLLRGCVLKNTDWVIGAVIYSGAETKSVLNSKKANTKFSRIQRKMNYILISIFLFLFTVCLIFALCGMKWRNENSSADEYIINLPNSNAGTVVMQLFSFWIQYAALIPISLYVVVDIERLIISSFIKNDLSMYYEANDKPATVRSSDIVEELGQVEFIFTDKTGTLTRNEMVLMKISIKEKVFGSSDIGISNCPAIQEILNNSDHPEFQCTDQYFRLLVLCNTVFPTQNNGNTIMQAMSPDELALVEASSSFDYVLTERKENSVSIKVKNTMENWEILAELPFTSERKRMSMIVKKNNEDIFLLTKGADSVMMPLIKTTEKSEINIQLQAFASEGLRTLVMAGKKLSVHEFNNWLSTWKAALLTNSVDKDEIIEESCIKIEKDLEFYGTSAIEDKLQEGVPETIDLLIQAGIRIWMLTGDKEETAIEIAKTCNLLTENTETFTFFNSNSEEIQKTLSNLDSRFLLSTSSFKQLDTAKNNLQTPIALAINGVGLSIIKESPVLSKLFFKLGYISATCVCCRLSPMQKYEIVKLCKKNGDWMTLAIGDGANDVSMIQEAHIGVGIAGKEGTQAVLAAEFTIAQFAYLKFLLLVHGKYAYKRISFFLLYYFYKNFTMEICEAWFAIYSGFSGQIYYLDWIPSFFNLFWTSWPCLAFFAIDQDLTPELSLKYPNLYSAGQKNVYFNLKNFWIWIAFAFHSGTWIFWLPMMGLYEGTGSAGHEPTLFWVSTVSFLMLMHTVLIKLFIVSKFWTKISL